MKTFRTMLTPFEGLGRNWVMRLLEDLKGAIDKSLRHPIVFLTVKQASSGPPAMSQQV